jgi:hypothetical protein
LKHWRQAEQATWAESADRAEVEATGCAEATSGFEGLTAAQVTDRELALNVRRIRPRCGPRDEPLSQP